MKKLVLAGCLTVLISAIAGQAQDNVKKDGLVAGAMTAYTYTDSGWYSSTVTSDCAAGWGDDTWTLTLTAAKDLTVTVADCCLIGDYYEIYVNDCLIGTTPQVDPAGTTLSVGSATTSLAPGVYVIKVRDAFDLAANPLYCPAGFEVTGALSDYTGGLPCSIKAQVDIKPGSCPNPFNPKSKGSVPVAIVGTAFLDVTTIDPASITLAGVQALAEYEIKDCTEPGTYDPADCSSCFEATPTCDTDGDGIDDAYCGDGYMDLVVKFDTQKLGTAIGTKPGCYTLKLAGKTYGGVSVSGVDTLLIKK